MKVKQKARLRIIPNFDRPALWPLRGITVVYLNTHNEMEFVGMSVDNDPPDLDLFFRHLFIRGLL